MKPRDDHRSCLWSGAKNCGPDFGRGTALDSQSTECELTLANAMLEFDASDRDGGVAKDLEPEHRSSPRLHASVVLLDHVVQVFRRPQPRSLPARAFAWHLSHCMPACWPTDVVNSLATSTFARWPLDSLAWISPEAMDVARRTEAEGFQGRGRNASVRVASAPNVLPA